MPNYTNVDHIEIRDATAKVKEGWALPVYGGSRPAGDTTDKQDWQNLREALIARGKPENEG